LDQCSLRVKLRADKQLLTDGVEIHRRIVRINDFVNQLHLTEVSAQELMALDYEVTSKPVTALPSAPYLTPGETVGVSLYHFVPRLFLIRYDSVEEHAQQIVKAFSGVPDPWDDEPEEEEVSSLSQEFKDSILSPCVLVSMRASESIHVFARNRLEQSLTELQQSFTLENYQKFLSLMNAQNRATIFQALTENRSRLIQLARQGAPPEYRTRYQQLPAFLEFAADVAVTFFQDYVRYLAPLRDEPKPIYPLSGSTDPTDVGFRGEHTAAVLELNRNRTIEYIRSADLVTAVDTDERYRATLIAAVLDWLQYMGVVSNVKTHDMGKLGHELKVATNNADCLRDLTHVGVGVSQVLPIVVMALLAERGSTLIFEQPELHLHPRVQSRLADFFLSMILLGKQCIVETHSEHFISKLRHRVASSEQEGLASKIVVYFVESIDGRSQYKPVEITNTGGIRNWPPGFFDEGEELASEILKAALTKRSRANGPK
jgi:hypothetical protein